MEVLDYKPHKTVKGKFVASDAEKEKLPLDQVIDHIKEKYGEEDTHIIRRRTNNTNTNTVNGNLEVRNGVKRLRNTHAAMLSERFGDVF